MSFTRPIELGHHWSILPVLCTRQARPDARGGSSARGWLPGAGAQPPACFAPGAATSKYWGFAALAVAGVIAFYVYIKCCGGSNGGGDEEGETGVAPATRCCLRRRGPRGKRLGTTGDASEAPAGATLAVRGLSTRAAPPTMDSVASPPSRAVAAGHPVRPRGRAQLREGHMRIDPRTHAPRTVQAYMDTPLGMTVGRSPPPPPPPDNMAPPPPPLREQARTVTVR